LNNETQLSLAGRLSSRELATVLAALRKWQNSMATFGLNDDSKAVDVAKAVEKNRPSFDHFEDAKPLTLPQIERLCLRIGLGPKKRIVSVNLDQSEPIDTSDSAILNRIDDLLCNEFGEDEREEISGDDCFELLRTIADDLIDSRIPRQIAESGRVVDL
jgi:hypothetical protein